MRPKKLLFQATVQGAILINMDTYFTTNNDYNILDVCITNKVRALRRGKAVDWSGEHPTAQKTYQLWHWAHLVPCELELRVRRLKHLQAVVRSPMQHEQYIAMMFGIFRFESRPTSNPDGTLHPEAHPFVQRALADIESIDVIDEGQAFLEYCRPRSVHDLFHQQQLREYFSNLIFTSFVVINLV